MDFSMYELCEIARELINDGSTFEAFVDFMETEHGMDVEENEQRLIDAWNVETKRKEAERTKSIELRVRMLKRSIDDAESQSEDPDISDDIEDILNKYGFERIQIEES